MRRIVRFEGMGNEAYPDQVPAEARELIRSLLEPNADARLGSLRAGGMATVRSHAFFEGLDGDSLYTQQPPHLAGGAAAPQPHATWSRRQNSIMWSPCLSARLRRR